MQTQTEGHNTQDWKPGDWLDFGPSWFPLGMSLQQARSFGIDPTSEAFLAASDRAWSDGRMPESIFLIARALDIELPDLYLAQLNIEPDLTSLTVTRVWELDNLTYPDECAILLEPISSTPIRIDIPQSIKDLVTEMRG
jgi:hypothetical protein